MSFVYLMVHFTKSEIWDVKVLARNNIENNNKILARIQDSCFEMVFENCQFLG